MTFFWGDLLFVYLCSSTFHTVSIWSRTLSPQTSFWLNPHSGRSRGENFMACPVLMWIRRTWDSGEKIKKNTEIKSAAFFSVGYFYSFGLVLTNRMPNVSPSGVWVDDVHLPEVFGGHADVVVNVAGDLLVVWGHWSGHIMRVQGSVRHSVDQLNCVPVFDDVQGLVHGQVFSLRPLHDPPIVHVLVAVTTDLLLMGGASAVVVPMDK